MRTTYVSDKLADPIVVSHGENRGSNSTPLELVHGNRVVFAGARHHESEAFLYKVSFRTSNGDWMVGGGADGEAFTTFDLRPGEFVIGFWGKAAKNVDAIGTYVAKFQAWTWSEIAHTQI